MHKVLKAQLKSFKDLHAISLDQDRAFEAFVAFTVCNLFSSDHPEPDSLIYEGADPGIDSIVVIVNEKVVLTFNEMQEIFKSRKSDNDVVVLMSQSTTSESWEKAKLNNFESAVTDFISEESFTNKSDYLLEMKRIFDFVIDNLGKVKGGKPSIYCCYASSAPENNADEIENSRKSFENNLKKTGLFSSFSVELLHRDKLLELYLASTGSYDAKFSIIGSASFPKSPGIEEGYVVTVKAKSFADAVLKDSNGNLRRSIFDENVRDFISLEDSPINTAMKASLLDANSSKRFGILNNGVTLISPDVRLQSNEMFIANYQIVNGCQTSNVIFDALDGVNDETTLMVKIIETSDQSIVDEIVESTNSQNKIEDHQFLARLDCVKGVEKYFKARSEDADQTLFFERRPNQYNNQGIPAIRIFTIKETARCCGAMFFDRPDLSARYPGQLVEELSDSVFNKQNREEIFYASAFAYYRLKLLLSNQRIDPIFNLLKWHSLMALKYYLCGSKIPDVKSYKIDKTCQTIIDFMSKTDATTIAAWKEIETVLRSMPHESRDDIRRARMSAELRASIIEFRAKSSLIRNGDIETNGS